MPEVDVNETAVAESVGFLSFFKDLSDPRQRGKIVYPLAEVLLLILMAVMAECDTIVDIADFGQDKIDLLRKLRPLEHGRPRMTNCATYWPCSTRLFSNGVSSTGLPRSQKPRPR